MTWRRRVLLAAGHLAAPGIVRLATGHWPDAAGRARFAAGFADTGLTIPPLIRGLLALPGGGDLLVAAALAADHPVMPRLLPRLLAIPFGREMLLEAAEYNWHRERGSLDPAGRPDLAGSIFTAWTGPPLAFLHFEKSGGTAVMRWLSAHFHPLQIYPDDHRDLPPHLCHRTPACLGLDPARFPLIWGHYDAPTLRRFAPGHLRMTFLREPRARLLSLYNFWHSVNPARIDPDLSFSVALAHRLSLADFLACDDPMLTDLIDNVYVRRLTGLYATGAALDPLRAAPDAALQKASQAIAGLDFVGITERLDASLAGLAALLQIRPPEATVLANVTEENFADPSGWFRRVARATPTPAEAAALDRRTALDQALYQAAAAAPQGAAANPAARRGTEMFIDS